MSTTSKLGADMLTVPRELLQDLIDDVAEYATARSFRDLEIAWRSNLLERARALLARQPAAIDKQCTCKGVLGHSRQCAMFDESMMSIAAPLANEASKPVAPEGWKPELLYGPCQNVCWTQDMVPREERIDAVVISHADYERLLAASPTAPAVEQDERGASNADIAAAATQHCYARTAADGWIFGHVSELRAFIRAASTSANVAQGAEAVQFVFPPMPQAIVMHEKLGPLFDRLSMHFYADKCMRIVAPPAQAALTDDARDAARYRWLKAWGKTDGWPDEAIDREAAIDAALTAAQSASEGNHAG